MAQERLRGWLTSVCHVPTPTPTWSGGAVPLAICSAAARFTGASRWRRPPWLSTPSGSLAGAAVLSICGAGRRTGPPGRRGCAGSGSAWGNSAVQYAVGGDTPTVRLYAPMASTQRTMPSFHIWSTREPRHAVAAECGSLKETFKLKRQDIFQTFSDIFSVQEPDT
jgi:hypothetical protein